MIKVLSVSSGNIGNYVVSPFVQEQGEALNKLGILVDFFPIRGKGIRGYLKNIFILRKYLKDNHYDILHGHFIWSILVCLFQPKIIKVGTFHGSDLNNQTSRFIADKVVMPQLDLSIVVSKKMADLVSGHETLVIPCGVDFDTFSPIRDINSISNPLIKEGKVNILFCAYFERPVKNAQLAFHAIELLAGKYQINLIELKALSRQEVNILLNLVDLVLMTSLTEGSPQIIKEAMACNCPIVSTDVGDVRDVLMGVDGCYITSFEPKNVAENIENAIQFTKPTDGRNRIRHFSNQIIAERIRFEYERLMKTIDT
jgi:teichuronic acid biosynthesis glycosyltransferase TuaC